MKNPSTQCVLTLLLPAVLIIAVALSWFPEPAPVAAQDVSAQERERPHVGPVIISPWMGGWDDYIRPLVRAGNFDLAKVHLPPGYATTPEHVEDLIEDGVEVIVLKTEDCHSDAETTGRHLVDGGFLDLIQDYPEIQFVIQVGNEPERCPISMGTYVDGLFEVATEVRPVVDQPNLEWVAGLPMVPATAKQLIDDGWILDLYDGLGTNMLAHYSLLDERHGWHEIVDYVLEETEADIWLTELGINHPPMDKAEKARRMKAYIDQLPDDRVRGVNLFALAKGSEWPQYEFHESMVPVFNDREECRYFVATDEWLCDGFKSFWDEFGGLETFGYPITSEYRDENGRNIQYFERARFEWHPGVWPEYHDVLLGHLGRELIADRRDEAPFQKVSSGHPPGSDCTYFDDTEQFVCDEFLDFWNEFGGLPTFGYPLSQPFIEDGFRVQYFERARLEYQPGTWPERYDILRGLLGVQQLENGSSED